MYSVHSFTHNPKVYMHILYKWDAIIWVVCCPGLLTMYSCTSAPHIYMISCRSPYILCNKNCVLSLHIYISTSCKLEPCMHAFVHLCYITCNVHVVCQTVDHVEFLTRLHACIHAVDKCTQLHYTCTYSYCYIFILIYNIIWTNQLHTVSPLDGCTA